MFVNQNNKLTDRQKHGSMRRGSEDGTELQPMVRQECRLGTCLPADVLVFVSWEQM